MTVKTETLISVSFRSDDDYHGTAKVEVGPDYNVICFRQGDEIIFGLTREDLHELANMFPVRSTDPWPS